MMTTILTLFDRSSVTSTSYEKEDRIRARFKIRGRENIKSQFMRDLRKKFRECTKKQIDFYPDIVINLQFEKETTSHKYQNETYNYFR